MKTVAEFSHGIVDDYRERQKTRLQRTFVGAEDATKAKYNKGNKASNLIRTPTKQHKCFNLLVSFFHL